MKRTILVRLFALSLCAACACVAASAQEPAQRSRRPVLDNLSLPSRAPATESGGEAASGWRLVAPEGEGFSVRMPGTPERRVEAGQGAGGRGYRLDAGGILYEVISTDTFPEQLYQLNNFERSFLDSLSGALEAGAQREWPQMRLRLVSADETSLGGYGGRAVELASAEYRSSVRAFLVNRRLVFVAMTGRKSAFTEENVAKFFGSLRLN